MEENEQKKDLYAILGVKEDATKKEIKNAYKQRAKETHPDKEGGSEEAFKEVNEAFDVLGDDERRAVYDETGDTEKQDNNARIIEFLLNSILPTIMTAVDVTRVDVIGAIHEYIDDSYTDVLKEELDQNRKIKRIQEFSKRLRIKRDVDGENVFKSILDGKEQELARGLLFCEREKEFLREAKEFIANYEYVVDDLLGMSKKKQDGDKRDKKVLLEQKKEGIADKFVSEQSDKGK
jgi:curved DNA-binding protein CbpA